MEAQTRTLLKQKELEQSMLNDHELRHKYDISLFRSTVSPTRVLTQERRGETGEEDERGGD